MLGAGHKVRVLDRAPEVFRSPLADVEYHFGHFSDSSLLAEALEGVDMVYHLISTTVPSTSNLNPVEDVRSNLINTLHLLQLMVQKNIPKIIFLSSGGTVYGIPDVVPIPESHPLRPICSYGVVKVAIENYLFMFHQLHHLQYVILRPSNPYGERQGHAGVQGAISSFMKKILEGEMIEIWGDGSVVRDFVYVGDLADVCIHAGCLNVNGTFNVGSGKGHSINEVITKLGVVTQKPVEPTFKAGRDYDVPEVVLDITKAAKVFGWQPKNELAEGMKRTWRWMIERG